MRFSKATHLIAVIVMLAIVLGINSQAFSQSKAPAALTKAAYLSVQHEIVTTGLPLVGPVVVINSQDFSGDRLERSTKTSKITLGDSVLSNVTIIAITDFRQNRQLLINPQMQTCTEKIFAATDFPAIDSSADADLPQIQIMKTGKTRVIDGKNCVEVYFKLDQSSSTGVGAAKVKHNFEGSMWVTKDIPNYKLFLDYNAYAHSTLRGSNYASGGFFDILSRLDVDEYNLVKLIKGLDGLPVEGSFMAQLPTNAGGNVFETKIKLQKYSAEPFPAGHFDLPKEYKQIPYSEFKSF